MARCGSPGHVGRWAGKCPTPLAMSAIRLRRTRASPRAGRGLRIELGPRTLRLVGRGELDFWDTCPPDGSFRGLPRHSHGPYGLGHVPGIPGIGSWSQCLMQTWGLPRQSPACKHLTTQLRHVKQRTHDGTFQAGGGTVWGLYGRASRRLGDSASLLAPSPVFFFAC